ncbi:MAG: ATP-binding protein [Chitinispirillia bacterium]|nr:ATP-binding protein [Chitinispirillia bacterium]
MGDRMTMFRRILLLCIIPQVIIFAVIIVLINSIVYNKSIAPADEKTAMSLIILVSVLGILISILILFFAVKRILKPIKMLTEGANLIANGEFDVNLDSLIDTQLLTGEKATKNEAYILFAALKNMKARLSQTQKIKAVSKAKSDFLATVSHEIRTPMNAITGMTELALRENMPAAAREHVLTIKQASSNLLSLINDILDLSKIESGKLEITNAPYHFSALINDVVSIIRMRTIDSNVRFVVNTDSRIPNALFGDETRIRQVLLNILSNAVKYTPKGYITFVVFGEITEEDTVLLTIEVTDTGKGIKEEDIKKLFSDFVQVDTAGNRDILGTGLGLAITKNLVTAMGGDIGVISEYKKGSTFTITLPQKILMPQPLAVVDKPQEKRAIVYERREVFANSIVCTVDNLGVECDYAGDEADFRGKLKEKEYTFIFVESHMYANVKKIVSEASPKAKMVQLMNFGDSAADKESSVIVMPAYSVPVANILNGVSDLYYYTGEDMLVRFNAPQARVLIVDDISTNLKVTQGLLLPYKMQVDLCSSGDKAINAVKANRYDLVLMDHMMPGMDGMETVRRIRESQGDYCKSLPVIAFTANAVSGMREMFLSNGFDDFISKPVDVVRLNAILEKWIPKDKKLAITFRAVPEMRHSDDITLDGVDVPLGLSRMGVSASGYLRAIEIFDKDVREKLEQIKSSLENGDTALYTTYIHGLKGAAAAIGAVALSEYAKELEMAAKRGDSAFIEANTPAFFEKLETLSKNIKNVIREKKQKPTPENDVDMKELKAAMISLAAAIEEVDTAVINSAAKRLREFENISGETGGVVESILRNILNGGYDDAVFLIESFLKKEQV